MQELRTALTRRLDIRHPIILAPMGGCAGGALAAAVSDAGGLGIIGGGFGDPDALETEYARAGNTRVGVGFITWALAKQPEALDAALGHNPSAIMLSFGDHTPYVESIKRAGVPLICQVQTLEQAVHAANSGADVIVAQGQEAGGHGMSARGTISLVPAIADAVDDDLPVVAAGGLADGRGLAAALMLGGSGVLMGTRFCATHEALWADARKAVVTTATGDDTLRTEVFDLLNATPWPSPYDGRAVRNPTVDRWSADVAGLNENIDAERALYAEASARGEWPTDVVWAGEGVDLIDSILPAADVVERTVAAAIAMLTNAPTYSVR